MCVTCQALGRQRRERRSGEGSAATLKAGHRLVGVAAGEAAGGSGSPWAAHKPAAPRAASHRAAPATAMLAKAVAGNLATQAVGRQGAAASSHRAAVVQCKVAGQEASPHSPAWLLCKCKGSGRNAWNWKPSLFTLA